MKNYQKWDVVVAVQESARVVALVVVIVAVPHVQALVQVRVEEVAVLHRVSRDVRVLAIHLVVQVVQKWHIKKYSINSLFL